MSAYYQGPSNEFSPGEAWNQQIAEAYTFTSA